MNKPLYVNIDADNMTAEGFEFLACQRLEPELYFSGAAIDTLSPSALDAIRALVAQHKLHPIVHAPFFNLDAGAREPRVQRLFHERLSWAIDAAKSFQASQIVVHPGYGPWVPVRKFEEWLLRAQPVLAEVVDKAGEAGIRLAFENIYDADPGDLSILLQTFPATHVGVCLDIGHFNLFSESGLKVWLEAFGGRLFEVHLHDNFGMEDDHIAVGDGNAKYGQLISWLQGNVADPLLTLEMPEKTHVIKSTNRVRAWFP